MQKLEPLSRFYCVSSTTSDPKRCHRLPKIRGNPITEGVGAVKRIVEHVQVQLPGIRIPAMSADFIKDSSGTWWFIRVVNFDAFYRVLVPQEVMYLPESVTQVHELMRSRYFRQTLGSNTGSPSDAAPAEKNLNLTIPECFLCGSLCEFSKSLTQELVTLLKDSDDSHGGVLKELKEYRMTLKMAVDTIYLLRQRAVLMPTWESAVVTLRKSPVQTAEFTVCLLCYRIYKQQQKLHDVALELHGIFNAVSGSVADQLSESSMNHSMRDARATKDIFDLAFVSERDTPPAFAAKPMRALLDQIQHFQSEFCPSLNRGPADERHSVNEYSAVKGEDVDPTCTQMRLAFFFHELQDGGPDLVPTDFYLEYQLGQVFNRLHLEGSKCHTPNRWQLCETRIHYFCATFDSFADYCLEKRLLIKMKTIEGDEFHGCTVLSLRPLITAAKRFGNSLFPESRTDYLVEIRTDTYGLLTLKLTLGLLVDSVPFSHVREILLGKDFLREEPMGVYWPSSAFCYTGLAVPRDWVGALMPSEYISVVPMRSHMANHNGRLNRAIGSTHELSQLANTSSRKLKGSAVPAAAAAGDSLKANRSRSTRRSSVTSARDSLLQFQRDFGKGQHQTASDGNLIPSTSTIPGLASRRPVLSGKPLTIAITAARRIIFRIAGEVTVFPTFLMGTLLRSANFVLPKEGAGTGAVSLAWSSAASFQFTRKFSVDWVFNDMKIVSVPALVVLGELLFVLLKSQVIPANVELRGLEALVEPFWLYQSDWKLLSKKAPHSPEQRTIWNRVIRRCESAGFHSTFSRARAPLENETELQIEEHGLDDDLGFGKLQSIAEKALGSCSAEPAIGYRIKVQALVLCEIFEEMEVQDNGYIDIAEVRSLSKVSFILRCSVVLCCQIFLHTDCVMHCVE